MENKLKENIKKIKDIEVLEDVSLKKYTTFKLDGVASILTIPKNIDALISLLKFLKEENIKHKVIGNGSNLVFVNKYYDGVLIKLENLKHIIIEDTIITVGAGYSLSKLSLETAKLGLTGLEFAAGIPGTIGGAIFMNAGAYKSDMGYVVSETKVLTPSLEIKTLYNRDLDFHYRTSFLQKNPGYICLEAKIILKHGDKNIIMDLMEERKQRRLMTQPLDYPSAGSVFRNPEGDYAGRLIEEIGYKNKNVNGAYVSEKHANFIINKGEATGEDVKKLIEEIQNKIEERYGIKLKAEQEFVE